MPQDKLPHLYEDLIKSVTKESTFEKIEEIVDDNSVTKALTG